MDSAAGAATTVTSFTDQLRIDIIWEFIKFDIWEN
jgi:hypothetical protein